MPRGFVVQVGLACPEKPKGCPKAIQRPGAEGSPSFPATYEDGPMRAYEGIQVLPAPPPRKLSQEV